MQPFLLATAIASLATSGLALPAAAQTPAATSANAEDARLTAFLDAEFAEITRWVRSHTLERFGPVRRVPPELVFEIAFEGIQASPRHKSGIALRFPRMARWRHDKPVNEIDTLDGLKALLAANS